LPISTPEWGLRAESGVIKQALKRNEAVAKTSAHTDAQARLVGAAQDPGIRAASACAQAELTAKSGREQG
jgi:hypothetical protein